MTVGARLLALLVCTGHSVFGQSPEFSSYARDVRAADALLSQGDFAGVILRLESWPGKLPDRAEAQHFLGLAHYRLRQFEPAIRYLSHAMKLERPESAEWKQTVEILGAAYYFEGRWQDAEPLLKQAASWRPEDSELQYTLGMTYAQLGRRDSARHAFSNAFRVDPASPQAFALSAELMLQQNQLRDAAALLGEALARKPDLPGAASRLGAIAVRQGEYGRALELLKDELDRNPQDADGWHSLGEALLGLGRQSEAIEALKRAAWLNTGAAATYTLLAKIYIGLNQLGLAENTLARALQVEPRSYEAHFLQSRIYYKTGRTDLARKQLAIAERLRRPPAPPRQ